MITAQWTKTLRIWRKSTRDTDRGAAILETALIFPLVALIVFGAIDFGLVFSDSSTINQGTREAACAASVHNYGTDASCPFAGAAPAPDTAALICRTKARVGLDHSNTRVKVIVGPGGDAAGEPIVVCVQYPRTSRTGILGFLFDGEVIGAQVTMRLEGNGSLTSAEETALNPAGWPDCTL